MDTHRYVHLLSVTVEYILCFLTGYYGFFNRQLQLSGSHVVAHASVLNNPNQCFPTTQQSKSRSYYSTSIDGWQIGCALLSENSLVGEQTGLAGHPCLETQLELNVLLLEGMHCEDC